MIFKEIKDDDLPANTVVPERMEEIDFKDLKEFKDDDLPANMVVPERMEEIHAVLATDSLKTKTSSDMMMPKLNIIPSVMILVRKEAIMTIHDQPLSIVRI